MTSIDRTAYPTLSKTLSKQELSTCYELDDDEAHFVHQYARNDRGYLVLAVMLKTRQQLGYFIPLELVPHSIVTHISEQLNVSIDAWAIDQDHIGKTLYRYRTACRHRLGSSAFAVEDRQNTASYVRDAAHTMSDPADLINVAVDTLNNANIELPAFSTWGYWHNARKRVLRLPIQLFPDSDKRLSWRFSASCKCRQSSFPCQCASF